MKRPVALIVLDGWGIGRRDESNPIYIAKPENFQTLEREFPTASLRASGINVGLPWGEIGNSEVGHLTLGAGKVVYQYYPLITLAIRDKRFFENQALKGACVHAKKNHSAVNFVGLLSKANVHASIEHVKALVEMAEREKIAFRLHLFADGKDSSPRTLGAFLEELPKEKLATLMGRYYAMDREGNWYLTKKAYEALTAPTGQLVTAESLHAAIEATYHEHTTEEFLPPVRFSDDASIKDGDALIFFNYREDSIRQLAESFIAKDFDKFAVQPFTNLYVATMTQYEARFEVPVAFPADTIALPLGKVISDQKKTQLRLAETYKYAHVTYFFNGHREPPFPDEYRVLVPSLATLHADERPEMMAASITDRIIQAVENQSFDFILANYANPDTIGHTGNYQAALEAVRVIDHEMGRLMKSVLATSSIAIITSDHGNLEEVIDPMTGRMETQHDPNPVPFYLVGGEFKGRRFTGGGTLEEESLGTLADVAPTVLQIMGIPIPQEMSGHDLTRELT